MLDRSSLAPDVSAHLLLVEDVEINREIACAILEAIGYRVDAVADGDEAVMAVQRVPYDLVLMDVQMPGMDGMTATRKIRALPGLASAIPIVAMTANVLPDQIAATKAAGMNGHVGKPFKRDLLRAEIERCLSQPNDVIDQAAHRETTSGAIDERSLAILTEVLGAEKVNTLLEALQAQLRQFTSEPAPAARAAELATQAHRLIASAAMLGFTDVADYCSRFEQATIKGADTGVTFDLVRSICLAALSQVAARFSPPMQADHAGINPKPTPASVL